MTIALDLDALEKHIADGTLRQGSWGDGHERVCLMSAVVSGATSEKYCEARGWPLWLAELCVWLFAGFGDDFIERGRDLMQAIAASDQDFDRVWRDIRLNAILPIALRSIGEGDEDWRRRCREAVQWSIDNNGAKAAMAAEAAKAAEAAMAAWTAMAARYVSASRAARAAGGAEDAGAEMAAMATWAAAMAAIAKTAWRAEAAARDEIYDALMTSLRRHQ